MFSSSRLIFIGSVALSVFFLLLAAGAYVFIYTYLVTQSGLPLLLLALLEQNLLASGLPFLAGGLLVILLVAMACVMLYPALLKWHIGHRVDALKEGATIDGPFLSDLLDACLELETSRSGRLCRYAIPWLFGRENDVGFALFLTQLKKCKTHGVTLSLSLSTENKLNPYDTNTVVYMTRWLDECRGCTCASWGHCGNILISSVNSSVRACVCSQVNCWLHLLWDSMLAHWSAMIIMRG